MRMIGTFRGKRRNQQANSLQSRSLAHRWILCVSSICTACIMPNALADLALKPLAAHFQKPVWLTAPTGEDRHLWIVEQDGIIRIYDRAQQKLRPKPFLDISHKVSRIGQEEGLLCLAFAPDFPKSGQFYLNFTNRSKTTEIARYQVQADSDNLRADPSTYEAILTIAQPYRNHNGGWLAFGPDGYLYIGMGDGGAANDPKNHAQNLNSLLGKLLRIDVSQQPDYQIPQDNPYRDQKNARPEIYALGLRNPWRCSWDLPTRTFFIADVGQDHWEEIHAIATSKLAGANFGWRALEGHVPTPAIRPPDPIPTNTQKPIYTYRHGTGHNEGLSITGGYLYRGPLADLKGKYLFADYVNPRIWALPYQNGRAGRPQDLTQQLTSGSIQLKQPVSFAQDPQGHLYLLDHAGKIYQFTDQ